MTKQKVKKAAPLAKYLKQALEKALPGAFDWWTTYNDKGSAYRRRLKMQYCIVRELTEDEVDLVFDILTEVIEADYGDGFKRTFDDDSSRLYNYDDCAFDAQFPKAVFPRGSMYIYITEHPQK